MARDASLVALLPAETLAAAVEAAGRNAGSDGGLFLSAAQLRTLRALVSRIVPGPPEDPDPGAAEAGAHHYIDLLLGTFEGGRGSVFAGGPFSNRDGGGPNAFADFIPLDALEERVWRTRIEGSRGLPEREWNGAVVGLQAIYVRGLARLDELARRAHGAAFHELAPAQADGILRCAPDDLETFLETVHRHTMEGTYGAPEYGGNRGRVGWSTTRWPGDHQPHAYARREIEEPDPDQAEAVARAHANAAAFLGEDEAGDGS